jgi:hypothetical protein
MRRSLLVHKTGIKKIERSRKNKKTFQTKEKN